MDGAVRFLADTGVFVLFVFAGLIAIAALVDTTMKAVCQARVTYACQPEVEAVYRSLTAAMPGRTRGAKGPKGQPDTFRSCISCMISAQSLDRNTAAATKALFKLAKTPEEMLALEDAAIAEAIKPGGLYNNKTKNIRKFSTALIEVHGAVVPDTR